MNFLQLHEQLRLELLRRINRGVLTGTLLARQTGIRAAHISNFLHRKRRFSMDALDQVLAAQSLTVEELLFSRERSHPAKDPYQPVDVPLVSQSIAMLEAQIRKGTVSELIQLPTGYLDHLRTRRSPSRRSWERFVAVRASHSQAESMMPAIAPHAILVIDRHYSSLTPYRPSIPNIYAVQHGSGMLFRYVAAHGHNLILRPHSIHHPIEIVELGPAETPSSYLIGRVCVSIAET
jgi:hypothetical protein